MGVWHLASKQQAATFQVNFEPDPRGVVRRAASAIALLIAVAVVVPTSSASWASELSVVVAKEAE